MEAKGFHKKGKKAKTCKGQELLKNDQELTRNHIFITPVQIKPRKIITIFAESDTYITFLSGPLEDVSFRKYIF